MCVDNGPCGAEAMRLSFDHTVTTSWSLSAFNPELSLHAFGRATSKNVTFAAGSTVNVTVAELLGIAGRFDPRVTRSFAARRKRRSTCGVDVACAVRRWFR